MSGSVKIQVTKDYSLFGMVAKNRPLNLSRRKALRASMQSHGFIPAYPIHVVRVNGRLMVQDGQHRLAVAQELGLPVFYVVCETECDIAAINNTQKPWNMNDYAGCFRAEGNPNYAELMEFCSQHHISTSIAVGMLGNQSHARNLLNAFKRGDFRVRSREKADRVANLYNQIGELNPSIKTKFFIGALMAAVLIQDFDDAQLLRGAQRMPEMLKKYGTREGYLDMIENLYNFGRKTKRAIRIEAENALRSRNPAYRNVQHA